jgi:aspartyl protease family protein
MLKSVLYVAVGVLLAALLVPDLAGRLTGRAPNAVIVQPATPDSRDADAGRVTRLAADRNGHYLAEIQVNGRTLSAIVDTGASLVTLRYEDARSLGVVFVGDKFDITIRTANGDGRARRVTLRSVRLGSITLNEVDALVVEEGALRTNLLGMSFLKRLSRYEVRGSTLVLER